MPASKGKGDNVQFGDLWEKDDSNNIKFIEEEYSTAELKPECEEPKVHIEYQIAPVDWDDVFYNPSLEEKTSDSIESDEEGLDETDREIVLDLLLAIISAMGLLILLFISQIFFK